MPANMALQRPTRLPRFARAVVAAECQIVREGVRHVDAGRPTSRCSGRSRRSPFGLPLAGALTIFLGGVACVLPMPCPRPLSGQVTTAEGKPLADAEVRVESWNVWMPGYFKESLIHTSVTRTDSDGRWSVPGQATLRFALPVPEMPAVGDELTVQAVGMAPLHLTLGFGHDSQNAEGGASAMRVTWDDPPPWSLVTLPIFGVAGGAGQRCAAHAGGMIVASRSKFGAGLRGELAGGINATSAAMGIVVIPFRATTPIVGIELNGRYMRPWSSDDNRHAEWGPEIGINLDVWRLTVTALGPGVLTPLAQRRVVVGFGWGYF
jgi:hypothetical protein